MRVPALRAVALTLSMIALAACGSSGRTSSTAAPAGSDQSIEKAYTQATLSLWGHYWDNTDRNPAGGARIRATQGNGGPENGLVVDMQRATTFWQMAQFHKLIFGQWAFDRSATARDAIKANWEAIQRTYTESQLRGDGQEDQSISVSDDAGWKASFLAQVHAATGDAKALHDLEEMIPAVTERFLDPNQPRLDHGKTPAGRPLYSNPHGILYAAEADRHAYTTYGRVSTLYEATLALAALYAYENDHDQAYLSYATATYRWIHADLRNVKLSSDDTATGVYLCELMLDRASLRASHAQAKNRYYGRPVRALSAEYGGGTLAMAVLAARLYHLTRDPTYLAEAQKIITAFVLPDAFGRQQNKKLLFVNARDPWTEGYWYPEVVREVLTLPGVDTRGTFAAGLRNTAIAIATQRTPDGYYGADWSGPELDPADGVRTWLEESARSNDGRGGGQAAPRQIMTSANSVLVLQAAHLTHH